MSANNTLPARPVGHSGLSFWQHGFSNWLRSSAWPTMVLIFVALGLLWAFHQVTRSIVEQSETRRQIAIINNNATWHCNSQRSRIARQNCLANRVVVTSDTLALQP